MTEQLDFTEGGQGLKALLTHALALDSQALIRLQQLSELEFEVFVTTPFQTLASRRVTTARLPEQAIFRAADILNGTSSNPGMAAWPGSLPPVTGFQQLDIIPVDVVHQLAQQGKDLARQFSGPLGPPKSLLDQTVITVDGLGQQAKVSMRMIFTCTSLALIPGIATHPDIPRHLRVSKKGRWTRLDAPFGSVYESAGLGLIMG